LSELLGPKVCASPMAGRAVLTGLVQRCRLIGLDVAPGHHQIVACMHARRKRRDTLAEPGARVILGLVAQIWPQCGAPLCPLRSAAIVTSKPLVEEFVQCELLRARHERA